MFSKTARPSSMAFTMLAKLSSSSTMSAASLATSVPAIPIAMPMCALLSAGASFTPSPVTATICFLFFSASTMRLFWSALTRAKMISGVSSASMSWVSESLRSCSPVINVGLSDCDEPDLPRDRRGGARVVAGDHDHPDSGLAALAQRFRHLGPGRIFQANQPGEDQILLPALALPLMADGAVRKREHPQARARPSASWAARICSRSR